MTAEQSFFSALGNGHSLRDAGGEYLNTLSAGNAVHKMIVRSMKTIVGGAIFAEKVHNNGFIETVIETAKNVLLKKLIANPLSSGITLLLQLNPATTGPLIAASIMSSLEPTLTAPASMTDYPYQPPASFPKPLDFNTLFATPVTHGPVIQPGDPITIPYENTNTSCSIM